MIPAVTASVYGFLSTVVIIVMAHITNMRLKKNQSIDIEDDLAEPYSKSYRAVICIVSIICISTYCGYRVGQCAVSMIAIIELGACYLSILAATVIDFKLKIIPNYIPLLLAGTRLFIFVYELIWSEEVFGYLVSSFIGCSFCTVFLITANCILKQGMGAGDVKLLSAVGFMGGLYVVFSTLLLALISCMLITLILLMLKKHTLKDHLPFGPFIYLGFTVMSLLTLY